MRPGLDDTIVALSSAPGPSPTAVVRASGREAWALAGGVFSPLPERGLRHARGELRLPGWPAAPAAAVVFRGPRSYTGEDLVELWVPGAPPLVRRLLLVLAGAGARLARPGELTRRAFLRGRLDLTQAEAVLALTTSEDAAVARAALRALAGGVRARVDALKERLLSVLAQLEAAIDFSDEGLALAADADLAREVGEVDGALEALLAASGARPQAGTRPVVVLRGPANAGKSTLFNALTATGAAIVSPRAGTTRDVLAASWRLPSGREVTLLDTAGDLPARSEVEERALAAATRASEGADLVLVVADACDPAAARATYEATAGPRLLVLAKADLSPRADPWPDGPRDGLRTSARDGLGLDELGAAVDRALGGAPAGPAPDLLGTARQEGELRSARAALGRARTVLLGGDPARAELAAQDVGEALEALGALTGAVTTEDVLDRLFARFCVGK